MRGKEVHYGKKRVRRSFSRIRQVMEIPNVVDIQSNSYEWFLEEGLKELLQDISPVEDFSGKQSLEFLDYTFEEPKYTVDQAREHDATYATPVFVKLRLINNETSEIKEQEVFFGDLPLMTEQGTFIINGSERVVVSQLVRSPGVYYSPKVEKNGREGFSAVMIPNRGAWLEFETDTRGLLNVRIDRTRKLPLTTFVRALGFGSDEEIIELIGYNTAMEATLEKDVHKNPADSRVEESLKDIYESLRPGEPKTADSSRTLLNTRFFDPRRYDLAYVGRYKLNKKLSIKTRMLNQTLAETLVDPETGEILVEEGTVITHDIMDDLAVHIDNGLLDTTLTPSEEAVVADPMEVQIVKVYSKANPEQIVNIIGNGEPTEEKKWLLPADVLAAISYYYGLLEDLGETDDIDHLGNRRIRSVGELLQNQYRIGVSRMERVIRERMSIQDADTTTPQQLINIRPVVASAKEFFGSSQLSQFMDQVNPLSELSHKRRLSALGPGGLTRERAGYDVRDVHYSHYGRMCPIETPEGPNIGLINSLSTYSKINKFGFIETPYRKVDRKNGRVTDEIVYLTADEEDLYVIAQANTLLDEEGYFLEERVLARFKDDNEEMLTEKIDYMDVSPKQVVSIATASIPFLENDDSNRALMGANMSRQAVPLLDPEAPLVGTGIEHTAAKGSGSAVVARESGEVTYVDARNIEVRKSNGLIDHYELSKFQRSNAGTSYNQRPIVEVGEKVDKGDVIGDGPAMEQGEIALGKNPLIAFTTFDGYNFEDAIIMSERLVKDDVYTSIHLDEYESEARDTKLGPEEITREIPNVSEMALKDLDEDGIIRVGAEVRDGDILVGKVTPKGLTEQSAEEKLLHAIFGEKAREVRDSSLRVPHGGSGIVSDVKVFKRADGDELTAGVNDLVRVYIAQKRKISVGDKMAGRHGNKGVVSLILPEEDMPYLPDGTPVDVLLNPLGVPSRMNIGQVFELHLGMAARELGVHFASPVFDGATEEDIQEVLEEAGWDRDGKSVLYDGRTGEAFDNEVSIGVMYYLKLSHMIDDKMHARSTGPYSLVTQQPLGGKAQFGGQRFGEMEVWALEAYGASYALQEILTYKSDDVEGRVKTYEAIVKGQPLPKPGVPESFRVLVKELQALGLDMKVLDVDENEIKLETDDSDGNLSELDSLEEIKREQDAIRAEEAAKKAAKEAESKE